MATSNTYTFGTNTQIDDLIRESFERIGIIGDQITGLQIQSAITSANLELTSWQGKVPLQWTRKRFLLSLYVNQPTYQLPTTITRIVDVAAVQPQRLNSGGTASSSTPVEPGTSAANCFDPFTTNGCIQTEPNGNIAYSYGISNPQSISYVGITPLQSQSTYTIAVDYSFDSINWTTIYQAPTQVYYANQITWFVIENSLNAMSWRIRETNNATLAIQQIYFSVPTTTGTGDRYMTPLSYTEWMQIPSKNSQGFPSSYFFNEQINPYITLWPILGPTAANSQFTGLLYTAYQYSQDVTYLFNQFDVPQRFYDALVAGLTYRLAVKFAPDKAQLVKGDAIEAFQLAALTDATYVPLRIQPDFLNYT
jgi:hypothetical protein